MFLTSLRKTFPDYKTGQTPLKRCTIQRCSKRIHNFKFSKALRKGKSGVHNQEQTCRKFNQAEGNSKIILVNGRLSHTVCQKMIALDNDLLSVISVHIQMKKLLLSCYFFFPLCLSRASFLFQVALFYQANKQTNTKWYQCTKFYLHKFIFFAQFIFFQIHLRKYNNSFKYSIVDLKYIINIIEIIEGMSKRGLRNKNYQITDQVCFFHYINRGSPLHYFQESILLHLKFRCSLM